MFTDGILALPDGERLPYWGFEDPLAKPAAKSMLAPLIRMREGETAQVHLDMSGDMSGNDRALSGGGSASAGNHIYQWRPRAAGTWLYQNHISTPREFEMGLYGLLVVDPDDNGAGRNLAFKNGPAYDVEQMWVLDDIDPAWHQPNDAPISSAAEMPFNPKYFIINGVPNTEALAHRDVAVHAKPGQKLLIRLLNASFSVLKISFENLIGDIVSVDGTAIDTAACPWTSWIPVTPDRPVVMATGSRHDLLIDLDPAKNPNLTRNPSGTGNVHKVTFEFLDLQRRGLRNGSASNPLHVGRITTTITVA